MSYFILSGIYECICVANVPRDRCQYSSQYNKICILYGRKKRHPWGMFSFKRPMEYIFCFSYIIQWVLNVSILKSYSRLQHLYILFGCLLFKAPIADIPLILRRLRYQWLTAYARHLQRRTVETHNWHDHDWHIGWFCY